jgi:hypothetical protein
MPIKNIKPTAVQNTPKTQIQLLIQNKDRYFQHFDNKETGYRDVYIGLDSENIKNWGLLQFC